MRDTAVISMGFRGWCLHGVPRLVSPWGSVVGVSMGFRGWCLRGVPWLVSPWGSMVDVPMGDVLDVPMG